MALLNQSEVLITTDNYVLIDSHFSQLRTVLSGKQRHC